ncbi:MAG: hypothetical protein ACPGVB_15055 [Chitinophagales bacterium]
MNLKKLLQKMAQEEQQFRKRKFIAPATKNGKVCTRMSGIVYAFDFENERFEGWGLFKPVSEKKAKLVKEASLHKVDQYLKLLKAFRFRLIYKLSETTWLAYPINESDARQRLGKVEPVLVRLVTEGKDFEQIVARFDGAAFWFDKLDRKGDPFLAEDLRTALKEEKLVGDLNIKGLTPETKTTYDIAVDRRILFLKEFHNTSDEGRLKTALKTGGGSLEDFEDKGEYWVVNWTTSNGEKHHSAIRKENLTVMSAGICLAGEDDRFDLQSLVAVVEDRPEWVDRDYY